MSKESVVSLPSTQPTPQSEGINSSSAILIADRQAATKHLAGQTNVRVLFLGMRGAFSRIVLETLLDHGVHICGVLLSAPRASTPARAIAVLPLQPPPSQADPTNAFALPILNPFTDPNIIHLAWAHDLPVYEVGRMAAPATHELVTTLAPDVVCVACFTRRIPASLLALPSHGFLNVHPSLLPHYRGPTPLFWIFRAGAQDKTGVTIHWMDEGLDTGDIAAQTHLALPDGISGAEADEQCAHAGAQLLLAVLRRLAEGGQTRHPQASGGSYQPHPQGDDFVLRTSWSARHAFNFMRATAEWREPYRVQVGAEWLVLRKAISFDENGILTDAYRRRAELVEVQFAPGVLRALEEKP